MLMLLKAGCVLAYIAGLLVWAGVMPATVGTWPVNLAIILLGAHAVELLFVFKYVKRYPGPLSLSVLLALLFGLLHWRPLMKLSATDQPAS